MIALAVGAIPEGLPAAVTITLAIGVSRMAHRGRGPRLELARAAETLGSTHGGVLGQDRHTHGESDDRPGPAGTLMQGMR